MRQIATTEEMLACLEAIRDRQQQDPWLDDDEETEFSLRQMWMSGRDWALLNRNDHMTPVVPQED